MTTPDAPGPIKAFIIRHWPELRLRTLLFGALLLGAALPTTAALLILRPPPVLLEALWEERHGLAVAAVIVVALLMLLAATLARTIVGPVERLSEASRNLAAGRGEVPDDPSLKVTEIQQLYADFRTMEEAIERRSRYLRDFAASVSHEFKTPLAGISGAIELLEDHGGSMSDADRQRFLSNMQEDSERLSRLVKRMMELAKADMQVEVGTERTDAAATLRRVADGLARDDFAVEVALVAQMMAAMDSEALAAIATTLIENSRQAGASRMRISADGGALLFADNGPGIVPADQPRIFEPFFTNKRSAGGTGLGLAIARSLAEAQGARLTLKGSDADGTVFALEFRG